MAKEIKYTNEQGDTIYTEGKFYFFLSTVDNQEHLAGRIEETQLADVIAELNDFRAARERWSQMNDVEKANEMCGIMDAANEVGFYTNAVVESIEDTKRDATKQGKVAMTPVEFAEAGHKTELKWLPIGSINDEFETEFGWVAIFNGERVEYENGLMIVRL